MNKDNHNRLRCPRCKEFYESTDHVILDLNNGVLHQACYKGNVLPVKDLGIYRDILKKYDFFHDIVI